VQKVCAPGLRRTPESLPLSSRSADFSGIHFVNTVPAELSLSIRRVAEGQVLIEQQYLQRLLEGMSNKEIAAELGSSESAIKSLLQALFAKTGVRTRTQLVRIILERCSGTL